MEMTNCIFIFSLFFQLVSLGFADVVPVPPFNITKESILKYLSLDKINLSIPALYVFGDSFVDVGNNNYFHISQIQTNYSPYGIDFGKPTGRYTNGRTVADFIAQFVGLPFPPPVLSLSNGDKRIPLTGINYANGFTGILKTFGKLFESLWTLKEQVKVFEKTIKDLRSQFESKESFSKYMSKSLFFINSISYDLDYEWNGLHYLYDDNQHSQLILNDLSKPLQRLYRLGARKIMVNNAFPLGCEPHRILDDGQCDGIANERARFFNRRLSNFTKYLQSTLPGSQFVLVDLYKIFDDVFESLTSYGFTEVKVPCCSKIDPGVAARCIANVALCNNRSSYVFFDAFNPTEYMHFIWARRLLNDSSVSDTFNLIQLIQS